MVTFGVAFSSMIYQFSIAYIMSLLFGDIITNYILNAGIFILFLGIGSFYYDRKKQLELLSFFKMELLLSFAGLFACLLPFFLVSWSLPLNFAKFLCLSFSASVAFLSGMELPWLMDLSSHKMNTIGVDYLGMVAAGLAYPLFLLPTLGVIPTCLLTVLLNSLIVIVLSLVLKKHRKIYFFFLPQIFLSLFYHRIDLMIQKVFLK